MNLPKEKRPARERIRRLIKRRVGKSSLVGMFVAIVMVGLSAVGVQIGEARIEAIVVAAVYFATELLNLKMAYSDNEKGNS